MLSIEVEAGTGIVETAIHRESDPSSVVEGNFAFIHQRGVGGLVRPVDLCTTRGDSLCIVRIGQPEFHRNRHAVGFCRADMEIDAVDTTFRMVEIFTVIEDLSVGVTAGEGERSRTALACVVARTGKHLSVESVRFDTSTIVVRGGSVNRLGCEAVTLSDDSLIGSIFVEVIVVECG